MRDPCRWPPGSADAPTPELVKPALAEVWAACGALKKLPRDGRAAVSKALLRSAAVVKDVASELAEIGAGADADAADDEARVDISPHEDDMTFRDDDFDENELRVAEACGVFAQASFGFLRALVSPIVRGTGVSNTTNEALENALRECLAFQRPSRRAPARHPPQDADALAADARGGGARAGHGSGGGAGGGRRGGGRGDGGVRGGARDAGERDRGIGKVLP